MACGGCSKRQDVLKGLIQQRTAQQAGQRVGVVAQHLVRDAKNLAGKVVRTSLPTRTPR